MQAQLIGDFTHNEYRQLLRRTRERYPITGFEVLEGGWSDKDRFAILRHDIDMSPERASVLAVIETEEQVRSTYNVLLTSDFYNPLEPRTRDTLRRIIDLGHEIGLHFDAQWHDVDNEKALDGAIRWQASILEQALGTQIRSFSFHNTTPFSMGCHASHYGGLRNAYAGSLQADVSYISDSNGIWRFKTWDHILREKPPRIQVLTHPDWWTAEPLAPAQKICLEIDQRSRDVWHHYCELLHSGDKTNACDIAPVLPALRLLNPDAARLWLSGFPVEALVRMARLAAECGVDGKATLPIREMLANYIAGRSPFDCDKTRGALISLVELLAGKEEA